MLKTLTTKSVKLKKKRVKNGGNGRDRHNSRVELDKSEFNNGEVDNNEVGNNEIIEEKNY